MQRARDRDWLQHVRSVSTLLLEMFGCVSLEVYLELLTLSAVAAIRFSDWTCTTMYQIYCYCISVVVQMYINIHTYVYIYILVYTSIVLIYLVDMCRVPAQRSIKWIKCSNALSSPSCWLVGGLNPSENDGVRQLGLWNSQYLESHKTCSSHHQPCLDWPKPWLL